MIDKIRTIVGTIWRSGFGNILRFTALAIAVLLLALDLIFGFLSKEKTTQVTGILILSFFGELLYRDITRPNEFRLLGGLLGEIKEKSFKAAESLSGITSAIDMIKHGDSFSELAVLYALRGAASARDKIVVPKDESLDFWKECISRIRSQWTVLTYASLDECWSLTWARLALAVQNERIHARCSIHRIFLVDSDEELEKSRKAMLAQKEIGIKVSWVKLEDLKKHKHCMDARATLGTFDVAIADDAWVWLVMLDDNRVTVEAQAVRSKSLLIAARRLLREAQGLSHEF